MSSHYEEDLWTMDELVAEVKRLREEVAMSRRQTHEQMQRAENLESQNVYADTMRLNWCLAKGLLINQGWLAGQMRGAIMLDRAAIDSEMKTEVTKSKAPHS